MVAVALGVEKSDAMAFDGIDGDTSLQKDAELYSKEFNVAVTEATTRLQQQILLDAHLSAISEIEPDRFAGAWVEHQPEFQGVVAFTGDSAGLERARSLANASALPVAIRSGAPFSMEQMIAGLDRLDPAISDLLPGAASELDVQTGVIRLTSPAVASEQIRSKLQEIAGIPVVVAATPSGELLHTYGGRKLEDPTWPDGCTTGFSVRETTTGDLGVLTAGHCEESLVYHQNGSINYTVTKVSQIQSSTRDAQWMKNSGHGVYDDFWDGEVFRDVQGVVGRADALGDFVCHWGYASNIQGQFPGRSCGTVTSIAFDPGDYCGPDGNANCIGTWIKVTGPNLACWLGDSGGPLFVGGWAYGILQAGDHGGGKEIGGCAWASFMSQEYLNTSPINLAILH